MVMYELLSEDEKEGKKLGLISLCHSDPFLNTYFLVLALVVLIEVFTIVLLSNTKYFFKGLSSSLLKLC